MKPQEDELKLNCAIYGQFSIGSADFAILYTYMENGGTPVHLIKGEWINSTVHPFELSSLARHFELTTPEFVNAVKLKKISLTYVTDKNDVTFTIESNYGKFEIDSKSLDKGRSCKITLTFHNLSFHFSSLPIVGKLVQGDDRFELERFGFEYTPGTDQKESSTTFILAFNLFIDGVKFSFGNDPANLLLCSDNETGSTPALLNDIDAKAATVKWIEVNKSFKVIHFDKIGISFDGEAITVYLNAGFSIVGLAIDFYGLYLTIPLAPEAKFGFGLNGLAVSFEKPPISIAGGLYHILDEKYKDLYNGAVMFKFSQYGFAALASYCDNDGQPSFFMYLMLSAPLGGPAFFFVTGLALGVGINRAVKLPEIKKVDTFPFVAAAMGKKKGKGKGGSNLTPKSSIADVLLEMSDWIYPSNGDFFITAGIKFTSFGLLDCFVLLMAEIGNRIRFSLFGIAEASLPPHADSTGANPIAYARLAILVSVDLSDGFLEVLATLTDESYILDQNCKLTGGFALCVWFDGPRAGDFIVSIGGCHNPHFINKDENGNPLYPELDRVGINWKINDQIKLVADGYFAVTPCCMMAGARLSLTFESGNLKAWLNASADFLLKWKPFYYAAEVSVSIGVSYTVKFMFIHKTFKIEMGASLSIWGPEFSGKVRINWFIISFTISFGKGPTTVSPIEWGDFADSFLPNKSDPARLASANSVDKPVNTINIAEGLLKIQTKAGVETPCVNSDSMRIATASAMPCTQIILTSKDSITIPSEVKLGVVPMGMKDYTSTITVRVTRDGQTIDLDNLEYCLETGNFSPALWQNEAPDKPDVNNRTPIKAPLGISLKAKTRKIVNILPDKGSYDMNQLLANEPICKELLWSTETLPANVDYSEYKDDQIFEIVKDTIITNDARSHIVKLLGKEFSLHSHVNMGQIGEYPKDYFLAYPQLRTSGGQYDKKRASL